MAKYLIDANLPYYFNLWNNDKYIHINDIDDTWSDEQIWEYAKNNNLVIVTKDSDFSAKVLFRGTPPKVIHLKIGNLKMQHFHTLINSIWGEVEKSISDNCLINIYLDKIEIVK